MTIKCAGELIDHVREAVEKHGCTPHTEIFIRVGEEGPMYSISQMKGFQDVRGFGLILETGPLIGLS